MIEVLGNKNEDDSMNLEKFFSIFLQTKVHNQNIAINALKRGLSLDGKFSSLFR